MPAINIGTLFMGGRIGRVTMAVALQRRMTTTPMWERGEERARFLGGRPPPTFGGAFREEEDDNEDDGDEQGRRAQRRRRDMVDVRDAL